MIKNEFTCNTFSESHEVRTGSVPWSSCPNLFIFIFADHFGFGADLVSVCVVLANYVLLLLTPF